jgi:hypothetical protein
VYLAAVRFLPIMAVQRLDACDGRSPRWLARWSTETAWATIEHAAEVDTLRHASLGVPLLTLLA